MGPGTVLPVGVIVPSRKLETRRWLVAAAALLLVTACVALSVTPGEGGARTELQAQALPQVRALAQMQQAHVQVGRVSIEHTVGAAPLGARMGSLVARTGPEKGARLVRQKNYCGENLGPETKGKGVSERCIRNFEWRAAVSGLKPLATACPARSAT